jgi:hypothetical protein|nr:hypothetical protein [Candidatus Kapabacteria bacterium]
LQIPGFSTREARDIIYMVQDSTFLSYDMIATTLNLSRAQIYLLKHCSHIYPRKEKKSEFKARLRYKGKLNKIKGIEEEKFIGDETDYYQRFQYQNSYFSACLLTDKDFGEVYAADFLSGYLQTELNDTKLIVGNFSVESGLGNILWKAFGARKGANVISPTTAKGRGLRPYNSSIDNKYFRGIGAQRQFNIGKTSIIDATLWYSSADISGRVVPEEDLISSIYRSGYYRTSSEISKRYNVYETSGGGIVEYKQGALTIGLSNLYLQYTRYIKSSSSTAFRGESGLLSSIYAFKDFDDMTIAAELSNDAQGNKAVRISGQLSTKDIDLAMNFRSYASKFRSPFGHNFGEASYAANETGLYTGMEYKINKKTLFTAYVDVFGSFDRTYFVPANTVGIDVFSELRHKFSKKTIAVGRVRFETKTDAEKNEEKIYDIFQRKRTSVRLETIHNFNRSLKLRARIESAYINFDKYLPEEFGTAGFAELSWDINKFAEIGGRFSLFSTDSYSSAIWQFEYKGRGYMSIPAMYGDGFKALLYADFRVNKTINLRLFFSILRRNNADHIGSGNMSTIGNELKRFLIQTDIRI